MRKETAIGIGVGMIIGNITSMATDAYLGTDYSKLHHRSSEPTEITVSPSELTNNWLSKAPTVARPNGSETTHTANSEANRVPNENTKIVPKSE